MLLKVLYSDFIFQAKFLYVGSSIVIFELSLKCFESLPVSIGWNSPLMKVDGSSATLSKLFPKEKSLVTSNLSLLKRHISDSTVQTSFQLCADFDPYLYVYTHNAYKSFPQTKFTMINNSCGSNASECHAEPSVTCDHEHHDFFLPYFYGNMSLKSKYQGIISESCGERKTAAENDLNLLNNVLAGTCNEENEFYTGFLPVDSPANNFDEDTWTTRLFYCIRKGFPQVTMKLYAHARAMEASNLVLQNIPKHVSKDCFLFRGAPDIVLKWSPVQVVTNASESIAGPSGQAVTDNAPEPSVQDVTDTDVSDTSGESAKIEFGFQMTYNKGYVDGSAIPNKAGELVAAIHQSVHAKVLRRLKKNKEIHFPLIGHGLYVHKLTGTIHLELKFPSVGSHMTVKATIFEDGIVSGQSLCSAINFLANSIKKPTVQ